MQFKYSVSNDDSSLLPLHADVWTGFTWNMSLVFWLPLVDVYKTKSMFILPPKLHEKYQKNFKKNNSINSLYNKVKKDLKWINLNYGQGIIFYPKSYAWEYYKQRKKPQDGVLIADLRQFFTLQRQRNWKFFTPITIKPITLLVKISKFQNETK